MPKTKVKTNKRKGALAKVDRMDLTEQERRFAVEYASNGYSAMRAAAVAGYGSPSQRGCELLKKPHVQRAIREFELETIKNTGIKMEEVLLHLFYLITRTADDYCDADGKIITDVNLLNARAKACIDGIEQEVKTTTLEDGTIQETVKTKLKLSPKAAAVDMGMKHKGLLNPDLLLQVLGNNANVQINWGDMRKRPEVNDPIAAEIAEVKRIAAQKESSDA